VGGKLRGRISAVHKDAAGKERGLKKRGGKTRMSNGDGVISNRRRKEDLVVTGIAHGGALNEKAGGRKEGGGGTEKTGPTRHDTEQSRETEKRTKTLSSKAEPMNKDRRPKPPKRKKKGGKKEGHVGV